MNADRDRWADLSDRQAAEEELTPEELDFLSTYPETCDECAYERNWWAELPELQPEVFDGNTRPEPSARGRWRVPARASIIAVATAAAALAALWVSTRPTMSPATSLEARLTPVVTTLPTSTRRPGRWRAVAATGDDVAAVNAMADTGDVVTSRTGHACFRHDLGVVLCVGSSTRATLHGENERPWVALSAGRAVAELEARDLSDAFFVQTPTGRATALGTMFGVEVRPDATSVRVSHGRVAWKADEGGATETVEAGQAVDENGPRVLSSEEMAAERWLLRGGLLWRGGPSATFDLERPRGECRAVVDGRQFGTQRVWLRLPPGERVLSWEGCDDPTREIVRLEPDQHVHRGGSSEPPSDTPAEETSSASPGANLMARAQAAHAQQRLARASQLYAELMVRFPSSPEASVAPLALGRLLLQQGQGPEALAAFDAYLARGGGLGMEARLGRIQALAALGRHEERAAAIADFVERYPDSRAAQALKTDPVDAP